MNQNQDHSTLFDELCALGEQGAAALQAKKYDDAAVHYNTIVQRMRRSQFVNGRVLGKAVLGLLVAKIGQGDYRFAHDVWSSDTSNRASEAGLLATGIYMLENNQVDAHDQAVYMFVSAYLHTFGSQKEIAANAVNIYMSRICDYAVEQEPEILPQSLSSWRFALYRIFEEEPPEKFTTHLRTLSETHGLTLSEKGNFVFPRQSPWNHANWPKVDTKEAVEEPKQSIWSKLQALLRKS